MFKSTLRRLGVATAGAVLCLTAPFVHAGSWQNNASIGGFNSVNIYTPSTATSSVGQGRSLLIVLHGCTQPISAFSNANLEDAAEAHGMVIAVPDAMNKAGFSCWSYWQGAINRNSGDYRNLIGLATALKADSNRNIDPNQVYITGLSSGAAFAAQTACVAPDVFAGVAPSAGPTIGTSSGGAISTCETVSPATFKQRCESYAGSANRAHFATQIAAVAHGSNDTTVNTCYNEQNANGYANLFGVSKLSGTTTISENGNTAVQHRWEDNRVAMLWLNGLGHTWSGGKGASGSYVGGQSINFATYLGGWFAENNLRVNRNAGPELSEVAAALVDNRLEVTGLAVDAETAVDNVRITISNIDTGTPEVAEVIDVSVNAQDQFHALSASLLDGLYEVQVVATDDEDMDGEAVTLTKRVGPEPPAQAPVLSNVQASVNGQCATVTGTAVDANQNLQSITVAFANGNVTVQPTGNQFSAQRCDLPGGSNTATVTATDTTNLSATTSVSFSVDAGKSGDYNFHIQAGHITWGGGYSACYLEFGNDSFTMRESEVAPGQCVWTADGAPGCKGPTQACSTGGGNEPVDPDPVDPIDPDPVDPDPVDPTCTQHTAWNYNHKLAGRAYSTGSFLMPNYFANGSDQPMAGSTYGTTTLRSNGDGVWQVGACN